MTARFSLDPPLACADSWPTRRPAAVADDRRLPSLRPSPVYEAAVAAIRAQASKTAVAMIKDRAHAYALRPRELDAVVHGLFRMPVPDMIIFLRDIVPAVYRRMGFGGEVGAINLKAAMLYARYLRAKAHRIAPH